MNFKINDRKVLTTVFFFSLFSELPLLVIDTQGVSGFREFQNKGSKSTYNQGEVGLVLKHIHELVQAGLAETEIGVISPYNEQVLLIQCITDTSIHYYLIYIV